MGNVQKKAQARYVPDRTSNKRSNGHTVPVKVNPSGGPGGWTEQDLNNPQKLEEAKQLAMIATKEIYKDVEMKGTDYSTIDVSLLKTQVVNGINYKIEYSIKDKDGDNILWVTADLWRPAGQPIQRSQVTHTNNEIENINVSGPPESADRNRRR